LSRANASRENYPIRIDPATPETAAADASAGHCGVTIAPLNRRRTILVFAITAMLAVGCRASIGLLAPGPATATKANDMFGALALRFGVADRDPRFSAIRPRLVRHALTPSSIFNDSTIWTASDSTGRTVSIEGGLIASRYVLTARDSVPRPARPGDSRHLMHLRRLRESVHQWDSTDELALGEIRADEVFTLLEGLLRASERSADEVRADYNTNIPLTAASLSRLFSLDSLTTVHQSADGPTEVAFTTRMHPQRLRPFAPLFADYVEEYLTPLRFELVLLDPSDSVVAIAAYRRNVLSVRYASQAGALRPLAVQDPVDTVGIGAARDSAGPRGYRLRIAFYAKVLFFNVGTTRLVADVVQLRATGERGWSLRFRHEPRWHFPLAVNRLVRGPLRRPFEGEGARLEYVVRDSAGAQTLVARNIHIVVQESAIVRWVGALGATAMDDLSLLAEQEKDRFVGDVFRALGEDVRETLDRPGW
jgi:hypothetical protein